MLSIEPSLSISILSHFFEVDILCVVIKTVMFFVIEFILFMIFSSVSVSTADKLSSKSNILGFFIIALAIDNRCFCPPERFTPL